MFAFLLAKIERSDDRFGWSELGTLTLDGLEDSAPESALPLPDRVIPALLALDGSAEIPPTSEMELDCVPEIGAAEKLEPTRLIGSLSQYVECELDDEGAVDECELVRGVQVVRMGSGAAGQMVSKRSALLSGIAHAVMIFLVAFVGAAHSEGTYGHGGESIMVRFVADQESVPVEETAASVDSAASAPSKAGNTEHPKKVERHEEREQRSEAREMHDEAPRVFTATEPKDPELVEKEKKQEEKQKEPETGRGPTNSVASLPSVASEERRLLSAGGSDMDHFQSRILAAIREAIHFPKAALAKKHHGETIVRFTVNRDGSVSNLSVAQPSGSTILDDAALVIIRKASKNFPSIPERYSGEGIDYVVPILFKEKRTRSANSEQRNASGNH